MRAECWHLAAAPQRRHALRRSLATVAALALALAVLWEVAQHERIEDSAEGLYVGCLAHVQQFLERLLLERVGACHRLALPHLIAIKLNERRRN